MHGSVSAAQISIKSACSFHLTIVFPRNQIMYLINVIHNGVILESSKGSWRTEQEFAHSWACHNCTGGTFRSCALQVLLLIYYTFLLSFTMCHMRIRIPLATGIAS